MVPTFRAIRHHRHYRYIKCTRSHIGGTSPGLINRTFLTSTSHQAPGSSQLRPISDVTSIAKRANSALSSASRRSAPGIYTGQIRSRSSSRKMTGLDPNTQANYDVFRTIHTELNIALDFKNSKLSGEALLTFTYLGGEDREIILDSRFVDVQDVLYKGSQAKWTKGEAHPIYGTAIKIASPGVFNPGAEFTLTIKFSTTSECTALQWMQPSQTSNKKHPYMFSQCQAIHARSLFPCQDTPAVKSTVRFNVRSPLPVVATGLSAGVSEYESGETGTLLYHFEQKIPIPSYLVAIAAGDLASASIGPRSLVYTGPEELLKCKTELEGDVEKFIRAAEKIIYPYSWTTYDILILPPSFPYGGMENPNITFATPTIISGDKSNIDVIAHELAHSWSGNLVSNASWQDFWLNEGWTTYTERRIQAAIHGEPHFDFSAIIGWKALNESVKLFGDDHEFTKLVIDLEGKDPDDAFSSVPYEKGFNFLYHLDRLIGREKWDKFIPHYFTKFKGKSLTSQDFKDTLLEFFASDSEASKKLTELDWQKWFYAPGLPPMPDFDTSLVDVCYELADKWDAYNKSGKWDGFKPSEDNISSWMAGQKVVFLERIQDWETTMKPEVVRELNRIYQFDKSENAEVVSRYLNIGLRAADSEVYGLTAFWLSQWGRMKFVRPLYRLLNKVDRDLAVNTFKENIDFYHPICRDIVKKDLGL